MPKAPWSAAARRRLGIIAERAVAHHAGLTLSISSQRNPRPAQREGGVEPPHSKALRAPSWFPGARQRTGMSDCPLVPLSTLLRQPHRCLRKTRGQAVRYSFPETALSSPIACRFIPALYLAPLLVECATRSRKTLDIRFSFAQNAWWRVDHARDNFETDPVAHGNCGRRSCHLHLTNVNLCAHRCR